MNDLDRALLRALLNAPEVLAAVRDVIGPRDFRDPDCRTLAARLWAALPADGQIARDLAAYPIALDWMAEAVGAAHRMVERRLMEHLHEHRERLVHATGTEATAIMRAIDTIARELRALGERPDRHPVSATSIATVSRTADLPAGWALGGATFSQVEHFYERGAARSRCGVPRASEPRPPARCCKRCTTALALELLRESLPEARP